ncbi:unnamed protein product [Rotaria sordida]|uniref:Uncharacterized protein n=1 Tax=Rotaria sordida TaxID=392033 RepID=A0A818W580_9BILA|nr:unnamed protein product [Rotaria sordida]CAF3880394.1 unnamed protein product [Rotaria sordida]
MQIIFSQRWHENTSATEQALLALHLRTQIQLLETVAGGTQSSCNLNEGYPNEPDWQQKFFGNQNCVGSDDWSNDLNCPKNSKANRIYIAVFAFLIVSIVQILK